MVRSARGSLGQRRSSTGRGEAVTGHALTRVREQPCASLRLLSCAALVLLGSCSADVEDWATVPVSADETHFRLVVQAHDGRPMVGAQLVFDVLRNDLVIVRKFPVTDGRGRYDFRYTGLYGWLPVEVRITPPGSTVTYAVRDSTRFEGTAVMRAVTVTLPREPRP